MKKLSSLVRLGMMTLVMAMSVTGVLSATQISASQPPSHPCASIVAPALSSARSATVPATYANLTHKWLV
jgi:hypothetical protein